MTSSHYVLTAAQFDSLAAGYGSPDAVQILRDGQLAKRKLLLQALLPEVEHSPALALLLRAEQAASASTTDVLRHPHLDAWATRALLAPEEGLGYLAQVAAAAAVRAGLAFEIEVPTIHGEVYLPGLGAARVPGERATIAGDGSGKVAIGSVRMGGDGWAAVRTVLLEPGHELLIEDLEPFRDTYQWRPLPRLDEPTADRFAGLLREAWRILRARHPEHADAMRILLRAVVPLSTPAAGGSVSAASRHASGSVAVVVPETAEELCLLLLHEFMHMKLDALRDLVDLHDGAGEGRFLAPWRMDPRPVGALFQGVYAHAGVTDYWRLRRHSPDAPPVAQLEFAYWRQQNAAAVESLVASGELTPEGTRFVSHLRRTLLGWGEERVPADVAAKASDMVLAQEVRWKLRNWRPSPGELSAVEESWAVGTAVATVRSTGVLRRDAEGEAAGIPGIVGMIRVSVTAGPAIDPAAECLINGAYGEAHDLYLARVSADRGDDDAWTGWAVAARDDRDVAIGLRMRPDLVREISLARPYTSPIVFARWFGIVLRAR